MENAFPYRDEALRQVIVTPLEVQLQLAKDFEKCRMSFPDSFRTLPLSPDAIRMQLSEKLQDILELGERRLLELLYVIDIPEKQFQSVLGQTDFPELLTELILQREAYKVYLRYRFRPT